MSTAQANAIVVRPSREVNISLWVLQVLLAVAFLMAGAVKLAGVEMMVSEFEKIGIGQWFRYVTGGIEVIAAIFLLIPRRTAYAAVALIAVMLGAIMAHLLIFKDSPVPPIVLLVLLAIVAWGRFPKPVVGELSTH